MSRTLTPSPRASLLLLFPAAAIAAFGVGILTLVATTPPAQAPELPPPGSLAMLAQPSEAQNAASDTEAARAWAPLFGEPTPEPVAAPPPPAPEPEPEPDLPEEEPVEYDTSVYFLRGLVYQETGGWALLETDEGSVVIREGDILPGGEEVTSIDEDGVEIDVFGDSYFIGFDDDIGGTDSRLLDYAPPEDTPTAPRRSVARSDDNDPAPSFSAPRLPFGLGSVGR